MISYTVSQVNKFVKQIFLAEDILHGISIQGEISNFTHHLRSGHFYFTLKDANSSLKCVMFKSNNSRLRFMPENGMQVIVHGDIQAYERDGIYQLYCVNIQPDGAGALAIAFNQLKEKLAAEGLFDDQRKRPLPEYPQAIGVVTSKTGAALQDIINILSRRYPICSLLLFPALVQGEEAPASICRAIQAANQSDAQVLIVGRGGGSEEDLWAFNDENVAREIAVCKIPVISAVGHETDFTISDFVADRRAPTPSAAAEIVAPNIRELRGIIDDYTELIAGILIDRLEDQSQLIDQYLSRIFDSLPENKLKQEKVCIQQLDYRLQLAFENLFQKKQQRMQSAVSMLDVLSPLKVLVRGYTITLNNKGKLLGSAGKIRPGDEIITKFHDGTVKSVVKE